MNQLYIYICPQGFRFFNVMSQRIILLWSQRGSARQELAQLPLAPLDFQSWWSWYLEHPFQMQICKSANATNQAHPASVGCSTFISFMITLFYFILFFGCVGSSLLHAGFL